MTPINKMETKEARKVEFKQEKSKKTFYQRKQERERKSEGFGYDNNKMWDSDI